MASPELPLVDRNAPCPCGSGLPYTACCGMQPGLPRTRDQAFLAKEHGRPGEAERLFREALDEDPNDLGSLQMLGAVLRGRLRYVEALAALWTVAERTGWRIPAVLDDVCLVLAALLAPEARARQAVIHATARESREVRTVAVAAPPEPLPPVSLVMCCRNDASTIGPAIASVLAQTVKVAEVIVVDRGSTDASIGLAKRLLADADIPVQVVVDARQSEALALNLAVGRTSGRWLAFLDPDARWAPTRIARLIDQIAGRDARWGYSDVAIVDATQADWAEVADAQRRGTPQVFNRDAESFAFLSHNPAVANGNLFVERALFITLGGFRDDGVDRTWGFALRTSVQAEPVAVHEPLYACAAPIVATAEPGAAPSTEMLAGILRRPVLDSLGPGGEGANPLSPFARANRALLLQHLFARGLGVLVPPPLVRDLALHLRSAAAALARREPVADTTRSRRTAVVVLGMHRSGTSALTRALSLCGPRLPVQLMPAHAEQNPTGFWESTDVVAFNERMLKQLDGAWTRPDFEVPDDPIWTAAFELDLAPVLAADFGEHETILLKDPRTVLLVDPWHRALSACGYRPVYVVPVRHPLEVARSLQARDAMSEREGLALWHAYMQRIVAFADRGAELVFVRSSDLLTDWRSVLSQVSDRLDLRLDLRARAAEVDGFLQPALQRQRVAPHEARLSAGDAELIEIQALYDALLERCVVVPAGIESGRADRIAGGEPRDADTTTATFVLCIENNGIREQALLLCESIRRFAGRHRRAPIYAFSPRPHLRIDAGTMEALRRLDVRHIDEPLNIVSPEYGSANRVFAAAWAERNVDSDFIVVLDSDTIFLGEPELPVQADAAVRPVDSKGSATSGPHDPFEGYWQALAALSGTPLERLPFVEATIGGERVRASYNGGLVVARRKSGLLGRWAELFVRSVVAGERPYRDRDNDVYASTGHVGKAAGEYWGSNQAALAVTLWSGAERVLHYPDQYNVPLHLVAAKGAIDPRWSAVPPVHVHYHWMFQPEHYVLAMSILEQLGVPADRLAWLARRVPLSM